MKLSYWKFSLLILSWLLLGAFLTVINMTTTTIGRATFGALVIGSTAYLLSTYATLKPLTKTMK